jgi:hypothetical protein
MASVQSKRDQPWLMRTYSGHSSAKASNTLYRTNLAKGQTGLSVAFDLPTQTGYDADSPLAKGEVGKVGVPISHIEDMDQLFDQIPLDQMNTSMTINATAAWMLALYIGLAQRRGIDPKTLSGTTQNDIIKEYLSRGTYIYPPGPSMRLIADTINYTVKHVPKWNPTNICSYHLQEAGATPVQELAYALCTAMAVLDRVKASGEIEPAAFPQVVERISFFVNAGIRFVEECCKLRAFGEIWEDLTLTRYKVEDPKLLWRQVSSFRALGAGRFVDLVASVSRDPAMIRWLDGNSNRKGAPNENYARELMELFTIGRGHYTETDVREAARAFTGWGSENGVFVFRPEFHDSGSKSLLGETGNLDGDDVVRIVTGRPECARFISSKLIAFLSHPEPSGNDVAAAAAVFSRTKGSIADVVRHILLAPAFRSDASYRSLVKSPAEFIVGALKVAGLGGTPPWAVESMGRMGQTLFAPPTVKGWDGGAAWLSAGALLERMRFAAKLAPEARAVDATLALAFDGQMPAEVSGVLAAATGVDRVALALASPEFQLN